ncbi:M48 family metallopeptidase [Neptuniibacter halophilus]|uniref:M48 family metallopeptidase n=1 Tax=Neptuniibacter halophilus TaxID=651666 RepID=UPI0025733961|nr:M48 family metallopeptidase [Neptuniibacter halophilus]
MANRITLICLILLLAGCKSTQIKSFQSGDEIAADTEGETRLWYQAEKFDTAMVKGRKIPDYPDIQGYLQAVMDRLYPEFQGSIRVNLHKAPVLNAFALPNGSIYINMGMLTSLENEAQIASVLAHEGVHFLQKHGAKQRVYNQNSQGWALAVSMMGVPFAGQLVALNSMSGYSQEHETEADNLGFIRLRQAGYDTSEASRAFEILAREVKAEDVDEPYFFASHPKLQSRIENFQRLHEAEGSAGGEVGFSAYQSVVGPVRESVLREKLAAGKVRAVLATLEDEASKRLYPEHFDFLMGLALLKKEDQESHLKAEEHLLAALDQQPGYAAAHKALGFYYLKTEQQEQAVSHLQNYLKFASEDEDTAFAEFYLNKLM